METQSRARRVRSAEPRRRGFLRGALALLVSASGSTAGERTAPARRIVTLDGSLLETVCLLGGASRMVGADNRDRFPRSMESLPRVGDPHAISIEGVLSLAPDVVLRTAGRGPDDRIRRLEEAGIRVVTVPAEYTLDNVVRKIETVAAVLGQQALGAIYVSRVRANQDRLASAVARAASGPIVLFALDVDASSVLAAGTGTPAEAMIRLAGAQPVPAGLAGFNRISTEAFIGANADFILMGDHTVRRLGGRAGVFAMPPFRLAMLRADRLIELESVSLLGFGPRATHALAALIRAVHPDLSLPTLEPIEIPA
jgi:iron complex transport system substrate-binding protein